MKLNEFLKHKSSGNNGKWFRFWTKTGRAKMWLHRHTGFDALWSHNWPRVISYEKDDDTVTRVITSRYISHDPERLNAKARFRDDDGLRETPPLMDPLALMIEWVAGQVADGKLSWVEPIFEFRGDDPQYDLKIHAGGVYGAYDGDDLTKDQLRELSRANIVRKNAFKQKLVVGCYYLFQAVDDEDISGGVKIVLEKSTTTGDKIKAALQEKIEEYGEEEGDPANNPYPLVLIFNDEEKNWGRKYAVKTLIKERPSPEILEIISDPGTMHDTTEITAKADLVRFRTELEAHALIPMPFDDFFRAAEKQGLMKPAQSAPKRTSNAAIASVPAVVQKPAPAPKKVDAKPKDDEDEPEGGPCDFCGSLLGNDDLECSTCGASYEDDGEGVKLVALKCKICDELVSLKGDENDRFVCPECHSEHTLSPSLNVFYDEQAKAQDEGGEAPVLAWSLFKRPEPKEAQKPAQKVGRRRGGAVSSGPGADDKKTTEKLNDALEGDEIPF